MMIDRRHFLTSSAAACLLASFGGINIAFADAPVNERFVFIILRGAMDGLAAVPPLGDRHYNDLRGALALSEADCLPAGGIFGLHKSFSSFAAMYAAGEAAVVHAVATPYRDRSHFDAQNVLECGAAQPFGRRDGWLNRALSLYGGGRASLGLAVGQTIPLSMQGDVPVGTWAPSARGLPDDALMLQLEKIYAADNLLHAALAQAVSVHDIAGDTSGKSKGGYNARNRDAMVSAVTAVGKILSDPKGPRIATIEIGGWDTHAQQGAASGILANKFAALDGAFAGLKSSLGAHWKNTVVLAATEFGRTVAINGTGGTDHGTASAAFLAGGAVSGGYTGGRWPGLEKNNLFEGRDLAPTTDLRQIAATILTRHLRLPAAEVARHVFGEDLRPMDGLIRG